MDPTRQPTEQEKFGRHRPLTDRDAHEINRIEELSYDLKVREVMIKNVITTTSDVPLSSALELLRVNRISGLPVVSDGNLIGVISLEDIVRALQTNGLSLPVKAYMSTTLVTVKATDSVVEAIKTFSEKRLGRLPVVGEH
ncbi:MAG TPA: CBS domain-containing protein, partial [Anaerolineales bacterium]|nr:CBS domain-containing protein [Anaerolineales bacterium]